MYGNLSEGMPPNVSKYMGKGLLMKAFCNSDHTGENITRRSRSVFVVILNMAPIYWFSKKHTSMETSTFGSDFVALKQ